MNTATAQTREQKQRNGLLAMVHIAKKDLGLNPGEYEAILSGFKVKSSRELSIPQLERLTKYLQKLGWKPLARRRKTRADDDRERLAALRDRVLVEAGTLKNWESRLTGLVKKICGADNLNWVRSAAKIKRLLVVIATISNNEREERNEQTGS